MLIASRKRSRSSNGASTARSTRRGFLRTAAAAGGALALAAIASSSSTSLVSAAIQPSTTARAETPSVSAGDALTMLMDGNARYVASKAEHPAQTADRREEVAKGQHPFAVILACADSRVGPELIFDRGLGDLFVIRVAGNIADEGALGSIEYALEELGVPLVMVLGHERCGAVKATLDLAEAGGTAPGHIASLVDGIKPIVDEAKAQGGDILDNAVRANVKHVTGELKENEPILAEFVHDEKVKIVGARYDLDSGVVEIIA
jgi:carbonic anhydrase